MTTMLTPSPLEILAKCSGACTPFENMSMEKPLIKEECVLYANMPMGKLFEEREDGFRKALRMLRVDEKEIEKIRNMTVGQFLSVVKQKRRDEAPEHMV